MVQRLQSRIKLAATLFALAVAVNPPAASGQCVTHDNIPHIERFSALADVAGLASRSGIELILIEKNAQVTGIPRDYEGLPAAVVSKLKGTLQNCNLDLRGSSDRGEVRIHGKILIAGIQCDITRHIAGEAYSERGWLKRGPPKSDRIAKHQRRAFPLA
jgi:hypothetical protein